MSLTSYRAAPSRDIFVFRSYRDTFLVLARFGGDLLSHVLRRSTIGATALNDRVRNGAGCFARAMTTKPSKDQVRRPAGSTGAGTRSCEARARAHTDVHSGTKRCPCALCPRAFGRNSTCPCQGSLWCMLLVRKGFCSPVSGSNQAYRAISTGQLNALLHLHLRPIDVVVFHGPQGDLVSRGLPA